MSKQQEGAPKRLGLWTLVALVLFPAILRLAPIQHGKPDNYLPDTHIVRNALGMAQAKNPVPPAGRYSTYPYLLSYTLLPVYASQYALGRAQGDWQGPGEFGHRVLQEPWRAHLPARIVFALLASLAPLLVFLGLRRCGLGVGAWWGAFFMATCLLHVHHSVQERPWAPLITFLCGCAWACAAAVQSGRYRYLVWAGIWAGLAVATHQAGLPAPLMPAIAWLLMGKSFRGEELKTRLRFGFTCAVAFLLVALLLGYPYLLVHGPPSGDQVVMNQHLQDVQHVGLGGQSTVIGIRWATFPHLTRILVGYDPALVVLGLAGLLFAMQSRAARPIIIFALLWAAFFLTNFNDHARYLLPLAAGLTWAAGFTSEILWRKPWGKVLLGAFALLALVQVGRFTQVMRATDTRQLMHAQLATLPGPMDLAIDLHGPILPLDLASLDRIEQLRELYTRESFRKVLLTEGADLGQAFHALPLQEIVGMNPRERSSWLHQVAREKYGADDLHSVLDAEGITHVLLADSTPGDPRTPALTDALPALEPTGAGRAMHGEGPMPKLPPLEFLEAPLLEISPSRIGRGLASARLPMVMDFPLVDLWTVERPGPVLQLHAWSHR